MSKKARRHRLPRSRTIRVHVLDELARLYPGTRAIHSQQATIGRRMNRLNAISVTFSSALNKRDAKVAEPRAAALEDVVELLRTAEPSKETRALGLGW